MNKEQFLKHFCDIPLSDDFIEHYGVKGMKWGKRKSSSSDDSKTKSKLSKKPLKSLSNSELKTLNSRLQMERSYKALTKKEKSKGKKIVENILLTVATEAATRYVRSNVLNL